MANKIIINSVPPKPSKRIIGGSNQRSKHRNSLQGSYSWAHNSAPIDLEENKNSLWWKLSANRFDAPLSSSGENLYSRQAYRREANRQTNHRKLYNLDISMDNAIGGGSNQPINKKYHLGNKTFSPLESELDISDVIYPHTKKRVSFGVTIGGVEYTSDQAIPFSIFSSSVATGYQAEVVASGFGNVGFSNLHDDKIQSYGGEIPAQGPFTERFVGGILSRHNAPLRTSERQESFNIVLAAASAASCKLTVAPGVATEDLDGTSLTLTLGGVAYDADFDETVAKASSTKTVIGLSDAIDEDDVAEAIIVSLSAAISGDSLPIATPTVVLGESNAINVVGTATGTTDNGTTFAGGSFSHGMSATSFSGGADPVRTMNSPVAGRPKGTYMRDSGAKAPVNIKNIQTLFTSDSVRVVGNYVKSYEVVQTANRAATNMDLAFNSEKYNYTAPSAFITPPSRRALNVLGSADYPSPRQQADTQTNDNIFVNRFSAPGDKADSKQQFRDVASDQMSPNSALPFRNLGVRQPYLNKLSVHTAFGGYESAGSSVAAVYKTQRNETQRVELSGTSDTTYVTGNIYDNYFVTRPIPAGDSTQWFFANSGSGNSSYSDYVALGSRYPENITLSHNVGMPFPTPAVAATGEMTVLTGTAGSWDTKTLLITDASGVTVEFEYITAKSPGTITQVSPTEYTVGINGISSTTDMASNIALAIYVANDVDHVLGFSATNGSPFAPHNLLSLTQSLAGASGNVTITGSAISYGLTSSPVVMTGGTDSEGASWGNSAFTGSDGLIHYVWTDYGTPYSSPWAQLGSQNKNSARYLKKNNLFRLPPERVSSHNSLSDAGATQERTFTDQAGNSIPNYYSKLYREPPITSRYKPLVHQIETFIGSPSETTRDKITLKLEYSYGNSLMGFANRELNRKVAGDIQFNLNKVKRPYEALRQQANNSSSRALNGVNMIKMFAYGETIYPKEVFTYQSGSRARLSFTNSYWKDDAEIITPVYTYTNYNTLFYSPQVIAEENRQLPRIITPFTTSQGYVVTELDQLPYNSSNPSYPTPTGAGKGSIWPLDSFLYSDDMDAYKSIEAGVFSGAVLLADAATTQCGELMMTNFGTVIDAMTENDTTYQTSSFSYQVSSNSVTSQYVYSISFMTGNFSPLGSGLPNYASSSVMSRIPGGPFSRPPWTAGSQRRYVSGINRGTLAEQVYPFYNNYEEWVADLRLTGKSNTIIPEYRISEHVSQFKDNNNLFTAISSSLEITGASTNNFDGTNPDFYTRYATTENMEFLSNFMSYDKGDVNFIFNDYPRHFEINSDAIVKLLPYEGFYPVNRTLEISTLYSQSYAPNAEYTGSDAGGPNQWRALHRPFFAPGIMYNSIKSGMAVDYPIRRTGRNTGSFDGFTNQSVLQDPIWPGYEIGYPLFGGLYEDITTTDGTIPGNSRRPREDLDWTDPNVNALFWADRLPFESIMSPEDYLSADVHATTGSVGTVISDINSFLYFDVTASFTPGAIDSDNLYKKAVSNFLANVPQFFLKSKQNKFGFSGKLTKFVSQFGAPSKGSQEVTKAARTVEVDAEKAYMMEIGLLKTNQFNMYSNPAAFGPATSTGYIYSPWNITAGSASWTPTTLSWPKHRAEFAPFTPPYYYGPSLARITFMPIGDKKNYTLDEILNNSRGEVFVDFLNESGSYYDATSGSYITPDGLTLETNTTPGYKWNRAWINRMDIDASITIDNEFPTSAGSSYRSSDPNKWTIMPKWESPILDFPNRSVSDTSYDFATPTTPTQFSSSTQGMWHQYGCEPNDGEGVYMYIKDIPTGEDEEYDRVAYLRYVGGMVGTVAGDFQVRKVPKFVIDSNRSVTSLADLCGFDSEEIIRKGFDPKKAKRLGELADDGEASISEAILALPFYLDENGEPRLVTLQGSPTELGPKIKEFRKKFTKYSLPPVLAQKLVGLVPKGYPIIPDVINPFGGDEYDELLSGEDIKQTPVVYLMEHVAELSKQNLADIWQGIMPDLSTQMRFSFSSIDHYMPGDNVQETITQFPEILKEQINVGAVRDGHPRYDLLDIAEKACKQGFVPEISWMVFKVKERGLSTYADMIIQEVDGPDALGYDNAKEFMSLQGVASDQVDKILGSREEYAKNVYISKHSLNNPTYNWPYDYCSLIESAKINTKVGFRPDLSKEYKEVADAATQKTISDKASKK